MSRPIDNRAATGAIGLIAIAAAVAALLVPWSGAGAAAARGELRAAPVAEVTSLTGSADLGVKPGGEGPTLPVQPGQSLALGDLLIPGEGVEATIEVTRPSGVPARKELIDIRLQATVTVERDGPTTILTIRG